MGNGGIRFDVIQESKVVIVELVGGRDELVVLMSKLRVKIMAWEFSEGLIACVEDLGIKF